MKALLLNGSPNEKKCTYTALEQVKRGLEDNGVEAQIVWLGQGPLRPCIACNGCATTKRCAFGKEDGTNALLDKASEADAFVVGSPVFYAGINGSLKSALDRLFFAGGSTFAHKPGGAVVSARRAGTTTALDQILKYFLISEMPVVSSFYWTMVHGFTPEDVLRDEEGVQCAWQLGANMAWLLRSVQAGREAGVKLPSRSKRIWTNFIR